MGIPPSFRMQEKAGREGGGSRMGNRLRVKQWTVEETRGSVKKAVN